MYLLVFGSVFVGGSALREALFLRACVRCCHEIGMQFVSTPMFDPCKPNISVGNGKQC